MGRWGMREDVRGGQMERESGVGQGGEEMQGGRAENEEGWGGMHGHTGRWEV